MNNEEDNERKEERRHMLKGIFSQMKNWYNSSEMPDSFREKYGAYPLFWQDLETWSHTNILKKIYLSVTERKEAGLLPLDVFDIEKSLIVKDETSSQEDSSVIEDKTATETNVTPVVLVSSSSSSSTAAPPDEGETKKRKKNRWGVAPDQVLSNENHQQQSSQSTQISNDSNADFTNVVVESSSSNDLSAADGNNDSSSVNKKARKSRWSAQEDSSALSSSSALSAAVAAANAAAGYSSAALPFTLPIQPPPPTQEQLQQTIVLKMQLQQINERMLTVAQDAARIDADPDRPPSPPPKYDSQGKRSNTRVMRMRDELMQERSKIAEQLMKLNPAFAAPLDMMRSKPVRKIPIPASQVPNQSFIGLIIGPRGNTQKRMEQETNCKISIKGKGMRGSANLAGEEEEDLHVYITGEDEAKVEQAAQMVMELLQPRNEEAVTQHKEKQLRELALINGTLREDEYCPVCGEKGHKQYECPARIKSFKAAGVKCSICGDGSHPTRDCPLKQSKVVGEGVLDSEYDSLMAELNGTVSSSSSNKNKNGSSSSAVSSSSSSSSTCTTSNDTASAGGNTADTADVAQAAAVIPAIATVAPPPKRQQTIIHVTTVMTGTGAPPVLLTSHSAALSAGTLMSSGSTKPSLPLPSLQTPSLSSATVPVTTPYVYPSYMQQQQPYPTSTPAYGYYPTPTATAAATPVYNPSTGSYSYYPTPTSSLPYQSPSVSMPISSSSAYNVGTTTTGAAAIPWNYSQHTQSHALLQQQPVAAVSPRVVPLPIQPPPPVPHQPAPPS